MMITGQGTLESSISQLSGLGVRSSVAAQVSLLSGVSTTTSIVVQKLASQDLIPLSRKFVIRKLPTRIILSKRTINQ
jgi:hypothetical protein|tara:strand:- start:604 stop:834 length:231 start_codon:yes stop_codon:yes gene_type:complete